MAERPSGSTEWDAATYDRISEPQARWGAHLLTRLDLAGDERVLDAGCGSGRVTEMLAERLPQGRLVALDRSQNMLDEAAKRLERFGSRIEYVCADLAGPLPLGEPVEAVFSSATFHWVPDQDGLFHNLAAVARPGARLVAQCGGEGNIASVMEALLQVGDGWDGPWSYPGVEETRQRLEASGWVEVETWLHDEPTRFEAGPPFETYLRTVILRAHVDRLPEERRDDFVRAVAARLPAPVLDYVRLNITALRAA